jgi:hypothetical protein
MFSPFSLSTYIGPQGHSTAETQRGAEGTTIEVLLLCVFAGLYVFEFHLPLLLFRLSYFCFASLGLPPCAPCLGKIK